GGDGETEQMIASNADTILAFAVFPRYPYPSVPDPNAVFPNMHAAGQLSDGSDVIIARIPPTGKATQADVLMLPGYQLANRLTRSSGGLMLAGRTSGSNGVFSGCTDSSGGCAFFLPIAESTLALGTPLIVGNGGGFGGNGGYGAWYTADGSAFLIAG